jgi:hypothetical protein
LTELGDAELTEQGIMALSGHVVPDAARGYIKRTEVQRATGARKRRAWVEAGAASTPSIILWQVASGGRSETNDDLPTEFRLDRMERLLA